MPRHPVHVLLAECVHAGSLPTESELDALKLDRRARELVRDAAAAAHAMHATGERGSALERALRSSARIIAALPAEQRDPTYLCEPEDLDGLGPIALAEMVPR